MYEFVTGGGFLDRPLEAIPESLVTEGRAMRDALVDDISSLGNGGRCVLYDGRMAADYPGASLFSVKSEARRDAEFDRLAQSADWTLLVAPELDGHLARLAQRVIDAGGRLLGPSPDLIALASDKQRLATHLAAHGVSVPVGRELLRDEPLPRDGNYPAVLKPVDGAGSLGLELIHDAAAPDSRRSHAFQRWRLEAFQEGIPVSVAVLCGPAGRFPLPACAQRLSSDGRFRYLGGAYPLSEDENRRAQRLAVAAVRTFSDPRGYMGVDLVLGREGRQPRDVVIEINPRLTTSYVGLRAVSHVNLMQATHDAVVGRAPRLSFGDESIEFNSAGKVRRAKRSRSLSSLRNDA